MLVSKQKSSRKPIIMPETKEAIKKALNITIVPVAFIWLGGWSLGAFELSRTEPSTYWLLLFFVGVPLFSFATVFGAFGYLMGYFPSAESENK